MTVGTLGYSLSAKRKRHIACDLDGTLAHYDGWKGIEHIGPPVAPVLARVKAALAAGHEVSIFTARVSGTHDDAVAAASWVVAWCVEHIGQALPVTAIKHGHFDEFWDDKAVRVRDGYAALGGPLWDALEGA